MWCKLASPLGRRTQPLLSPASESSHPLRFRATQASTPDRDADCESCVAPDSPNLSNDEAGVQDRRRQTKISFGCSPFFPHGNAVVLRPGTDTGSTWRWPGAIFLDRAEPIGGAGRARYKAARLCMFLNRPCQDRRGHANDATKSFDAESYDVDTV